MLFLYETIADERIQVNAKIQPSVSMNYSVWDSCNSITTGNVPKIVREDQFALCLNHELNCSYIISVSKNYFYQQLATVWHIYLQN
jgi:hypothetical protein